MKYYLPTYLPFVIPVIVHNMSGYDSHLFVKALTDVEGEVSCIPQNEEKYVYFSKKVLVNVVDGKNVYVTLKFLDSYRFLGKSLGSLFEITSEFRHTSKCFTEEQQEVLRSKQHYPYEYMSSLSKMRETIPPPREAFDSSLNSRGVVSASIDSFDEMVPERMSNEDCEDFLRSWKVSKSKTLGDITMFTREVTLTN